MWKILNIIWVGNYLKISHELNSSYFIFRISMIPVGTIYSVGAEIIIRLEIK